ncbi:HNH endonuclease family protein [Streptomyces longwoodensis]|uniref:HNH endonuclease family protein n=1 Tax=Streptomyces longwoodensis TaxID=68231 RepID=UPI003F545621
MPLAEASDSGASTWSAAERKAYANDLGDDRALIAVSAASNRSKADQDSTTWKPPTEGCRCQYATDWIADKLRWRLSADEAEAAALTDIFGCCSNAPVTVTLARYTSSTAFAGSTGRGASGGGRPVAAAAAQDPVASHRAADRSGPRDELVTWWTPGP